MIKINQKTIREIFERRKRLSADRWFNLSVTLERLGYSLDLSNLDLSNLDLSNVGFGDIKLHSVNFTGSNLSNSDFTECNLSGSDLSSVNAQSTNFTNAILSEVNFFKARLFLINLTGTSITNSSFLDCTLYTKTKISEIGKIENSILIGKDILSITRTDFENNFYDQTSLLAAISEGKLSKELLQKIQYQLEDTKHFDIVTAIENHLVDEKEAELAIQDGFVSSSMESEISHSKQPKGNIELIAMEEGKKAQKLSKNSNNKEGCCTIL